MNNNFEKFNNEEDPEKKSGKDPYDQYLKSYETIKEVDRANENKEIKEDECFELVEKIKSTPEYKNYEKQNIKLSTLEEMVSVVENNLNNLDSGDENYINKAIETFEKTVSDLKKRVENYRRNIISMERLNRSPSGFRMEPEEKREKIKKIDRIRRNNHNIIQDDLRIISRFPSVVNEKLGINLKWDKFFSSREIENREFVKKWAYTTAVGERMKNILKKVEDKKRDA